MKALNNLDNSLNLSRRDMLRVDRELSQLTEHITSNQRQQSMVLQKIAAARLDAIASDDLREKLNTADEHALVLLEQRTQSLEQLNLEIEELNQQLTNLENERQALHEKSSDIANQLADTESNTQTALKKDIQYQSLFDTAKKADSIADEAELKAQQSHEDMSIKGQPYIDDELFLYLWKRKFGTTEYKAGLLTRYLDKWVADLIHFEPARQNYWNIQEIPKRLKRHAEQVRMQSEKAIEQLKNYEIKKIEAAGALKLQMDYEQSRLDVDQHDAKINEQEQRLNEALLTRSKFSSAQDPQMTQALKTLSDAMQHQSLQSLQQSVFATPSMRDDSLVNELHQYQLNAKGSERDVQSLRKTHDAKLKRLKELEVVRKNFKQNRFDDMRSGFGNQALITSSLSQFMQGMMNGAELWQVIQRNQQHRDVGAWPDFGSGGLGQGSIWQEVLNGAINHTRRHGRARMPQGRRSNSTWHWPNSGNGGFKLPTGRPSGGGFKTGGGF